MFFLVMTDLITKLLKYFEKSQISLNMKWEHFSKCLWLCFSFWIFEGQFLHGHHCDDEYMDMYSKIRAKVISFKPYLDLSCWKFQRISNGIERGQFNWEVQFNRMHHFLFLQQATWKAFCISIRYSTWSKIFCLPLVWTWKGARNTRNNLTNTCIDWDKSMLQLWEICVTTCNKSCANFNQVCNIIIDKMSESAMIRQ